VSRDGDIVVRHADGSGLRQLTHNRNVAMYPVTWSGDGRQLIVVSHSTLDPNAPTSLGLLALESGTYTDVGLISGMPSWSPDGRQLAFGGGEVGGIIVVDLRDGSYRQLTDDGGHGPDCCHGPLWSPDGELIAYQAFDGVGSNDVLVVRVADGTVTSPAPHAADDSPLRWVAEGGTLKLIFDSQRGTDETKFSARPWVVNVDGSGLQLLDDSSLNSPGGYQPITVHSPDGKWIATDCTAGVCIGSAADPDETYALPKTQGWNTAEVRPSWVPGGSHVVYGIGDGEYGIVVAIPLPEGEPITLTPDGVSESSPAWQPVPQE
jgi:Tol biopolymer transport system component